MKPSIVEIVRARMSARGVSQAELARAAQVSRANLCDWLGGRSDLRTTTLERVLEALRLRVR